MKMCLACSAGGHLTEILQLQDFYNTKNHFFVVPKTKDSEHLSEHESVYFINITYNRLKRLKTIIYLFQNLKILLKEKPDVIITTGAGSTLSMCYLGKLFRKKVIFVESFARVTTPSLFGKLVAPISDLVIVQWKSLLKYYKKAVYGGSIFTSQPMIGEQDGEHIFITVGISSFGFERLLKEVDKLIGSGVIPQKVVAQTGKSKYKSKNYEDIDFLNPDKVSGLMSKSTVVITHGGVGSIINALLLGKPTIVAPRYKKFNESVDNHQLEITRELEKEGVIIPVYDIGNLSEALKKAETFKPKKFMLGKSGVENIIKNYLKNSFGENINNRKEHTTRGNL